MCIAIEVVSRQKTTKIYFLPGFSSETVVLTGSFDSWPNNHPVFLHFGLIVYNFGGKNKLKSVLRQALGILAEVDFIY